MHFTVSMLAGPIIGAVIGYFTNYLAVKMLFRPRHEIKIGGWTVPMTPGVIPKGKARLAKAIGSAVSNNLLTKEDMSQYLVNDETKDMIVDKVMDYLNRDVKTDLMEITGTTDETYEEKKQHIVDGVSTYLTNQIQALPVKEKVSELIVDAAGQKIAELSNGMMGQMISMFLTPQTLQEMAVPIGWQAENFLNQNAYNYIQPVLYDKLTEMEQERALDMINSVDVDDEAIRQKIGEIYINLVNANIETVLENLNVAGLIEDKINGMDVVELENLVMSVMKNELGMIVNLGFFIGLIIGTVNAFI